MKPDRIEHLLGGWAAGTLTADERELLMREAARDQQLFNALADDEALRDALADPVFRARLRQALAGPAEASGFWSWLKKPWPLAAAAATLAGIALFMVITNAPKPSTESAVELARNRANQTEAFPQPGSVEEPPARQIAQDREAAAPPAPSPLAGKKVTSEVAQDKAALENKNTADARLSAANERLDEGSLRRGSERQRAEAPAPPAGTKEKDAPAQKRIGEEQVAVGAAGGAVGRGTPTQAPPARQVAGTRASQAAPADSNARFADTAEQAGAAASSRDEVAKTDKLEARAASPRPQVQAPQAPPPPAPAAEMAASTMAKSQGKAEPAPQFIHHIERRAPNGEWLRAEASSLHTGDAVRISLLSPADGVITTTIESPGAPPRSLQTDRVKAGDRIYIPRRGSLPSSPGVHRLSVRSSPPDAATRVGYRSNTPAALPSLSITLEFR